MSAARDRLLLAGAVLALAAAPAAAQAPVATTVQGEAVAGVRTEFVVTTNAVRRPSLRYRPADATACAATASADPGRPALLRGPVDGRWTARIVFPAPGTWRTCVWASAAEGGVLIAQQDVAVRAPTGRLAIGLVRSFRTLRVRVRGVAEVRARLYVAWRAGGGACAATAALDAGERILDARVGTRFLRIARPVRPRVSGPYVVCAWLAAAPDAPPITTARRVVTTLRRVLPPVRILGVADRNPGFSAAVRVNAPGRLTVTVSGPPSPVVIADTDVVPPRTLRAVYTPQAEERRRYVVVARLVRPDGTEATDRLVVIVR